MLKEFMQEYASALASQDWDKVSPLIHEKACVQFSEGTYIGKSQVKTAFERAFSLIEDEDYAISNIHWVEQSDSVAVCMFEFAWSGKINNKPAKGGGRGTSVLKNENGVWQLLVEHLGPNAT
ncbi:MAG: nuclear transport factor 2 family protein [Chloroflexota bacterium]